MGDIFLWIITAVLLIISLIKSKQKTIDALKTAWVKFSSIFTMFIIVMISVSLVVTYIPAEIIQKYIGADSGIRGVFISLFIGSISVMPGFAAFPLCAALRGEGIPFYIIAAFSLTLMNVGILTFPLERKFIGFSVGLVRNFFALIICIITVIIVKIVFGE